MQQNFRRHLDSLALIFDLIEEFAAEERLDDGTKHALSLAVDELFTNMVTHQPSHGQEISVELSADKDVLTVRLMDRGVEPFDVTEKSDPTLSASLEERIPGGLGIYLTKSLVDKVLYEYRDGTSIITLKKNFRRKHV